MKMKILIGRDSDGPTIHKPYLDKTQNVKIYIPLSKPFFTAVGEGFLYRIICNRSLALHKCSLIILTNIFYQNEKKLKHQIKGSKYPFFNYILLAGITSNISRIKELLFL